ncbi:MAG: hypothetical protein U1F10_05380 [Burkholderiales bacterium]
MDNTPLPGNGIKPLLSLRRHYRAAVAAMLVVVLLGLPFVWIKGRSYFVAESVFQVAPSYMRNLDTDKELELQSNSQYREYVNHLSSTVTRYDIIERALADLAERGIDLRPPALTPRKYIEQLQRTVYVRAVPDTYMVRIGKEDADPAHLDDLVNAITDAFLRTTRAEQIYGSGDRLKVLQDNAARLRDEIAKMEAERVVLADKLGLTTFGDSTQNPFDGMLAQAREKLTHATIDRVEAEAALLAFDQQKEIPTSFVGRSLLEMRLQDNGLQALRNEVVKRTEELRRSTAGLEAKHPAMQAATAELASMAERLKAAEAAFDRDTFANFRARLVASLGQRAQVEKEVKATLTKSESQASDFARNFQQAMRLTNDIRKREAELSKLRDRLSYLETEAHALGFARPISRALPPETPMGLGKTKLLLALLVVALGVGLVLPIGLDLLDRRVRTVNDAERLLGMPAAGWQVRVDGAATEIFAEEQTRRFASSLIRNRARGERGTFAFTSLKPGVGVTREIFETARVLARMGAKVLVVDANTLAPWTDVAAEAPGLSDYLAGHAPLTGLARPHDHGDATFDTVGIGGEREARLRRLDLLQAAIAEWSTHYEYVLFDLPPLLLCADTEMLIHAIGQVFLVLEAEADTTGEIHRARRLLQKIDPEAVGVFVTKLPVFRGAGYMEGLITETLTGRRYERFMTLPSWRLAWEVVRMRVAAAARRGA